MMTDRDGLTYNVLLIGDRFNNDELWMMDF